MTRRAAAALFGVAIATPAVAFVPSSSLLGESWRKTGDLGDPDYDVWSGFLGNYVRGSGPALVDYETALHDGADRVLADWLDEYQRIDPGALSRDAQMAWWINLYNAATVRLILAYYPIRTIRIIKGGIFQTGPWDEPLLTVNGQVLSLNDVEHRILRPIWQDPRVHYAINCASIGCPDLEQMPWRADGLDSRLTAAARRYINHPRGARVEDGRLTVSKIYDWFEEDFGGSDQGVIAHLKQYADDDLKAALGDVSTIHDTEYDWSLNATTPAGRG